MLKKVKNFQENTNLTIFLGAGLYQISIGLIVNLLVSILLGASIIIFYPIINPLILRFFIITGWVLIIIGIITSIFPLLKTGIMKNNIISKLFIIILKFSAYLSLILIPIGIFLGNGLRSELKAIKINKAEQKRKKEKKFYSIYSFLLLLAGFIHLMLGIALLFVLIPIILEEIAFLFPYFTYDFIIILQVFGWICFIPGALLIFCSIWSKKLCNYKENVNYGNYIKVLRVVLLTASAFLIVIFPIGTFFSLILIQEFYPLKVKEV
ncbi:MAG: hypothetical protein ACFFD5_01660 [Candidatus Thorarchaeota archaeon]